MTAEGLTIRMTGKAEVIPAKSFIDALERMVTLLRAVEEQMPKTYRVNRGWHVVHVSHASPFAVEIRGVSSQNDDAGHAVINACLDGLEMLNSEAYDRPDYYDRDALAAAHGFVGVLDDGVLDISLTTHGRPPVQPTQRIAVAVNRLLPRQHDEIGTIQGRVETLRMHRGYVFHIWDVVTGAAVECTTDAVGLAVAYEAWGRRVKVFGRITYSVDNQPQKIAVEDIEPLPADDDIPCVRELGPFNIRDGKTAAEHAEEWWHGSQPNSVG